MGIVALVGLVLALIGSGIVVAVYNPLEAGNHGGTPAATLRYRDVDDFDSSTRIIEYEHGGELTVRFSLRNRGPWGVTITSIPQRDFGLFEVTKIRMGFPGFSRCCVDTQPFQSFALHPGEDRIIDLHGRLKGCSGYRPGGGTAWDSYEIRYRVAGVSRSAEIHVRQSIEIEIPTGYVCPEPPTGRTDNSS